MRNTKIHHNSPTLAIQHDILWLQITVDHVYGMRRFESAANLAHNVDGLRRSELVVGHQRLQIPALDILHGDELQVTHHAQVKNTDDVAMRDLPREDQLALGALHDLGMPGQFW